MHSHNARIGSVVLLIIAAATPTSVRGQSVKPDLSGLANDEQAMIEAACNLDRSVRGPAAYYGCLRRQLQALRNGPDRPSLTNISNAERDMIERACNLDRSVRGPAVYYGCLNRQLQALRKGMNSKRRSAS